MRCQTRSLAGLAILTGVAAGTARSQDLLECVDPDVRDGLLGSPVELERSVTREWPEILADFALPSGFELVGTTATSRATTTALKTGLPSVEALDAVEQALLDRDWEISRQSAAFRRNGFVGGRTPQWSMYCRDGRPLNVTAGRKAGTTFVQFQALMPDSIQAGAICETWNERVPFPSNWPGLQAYMPRLELPLQSSDDAGDQRTAGLAFNPGGMAGSNRTLTTSAMIVTDVDAASVENHFAVQLEEQDWALDAEWTGRLSAGSAWTAMRIDAQSGEPVELVGMLNVAGRGASGYEATFQIVNVD